MLVRAEIDIPCPHCKGTGVLTIPKEDKLPKAQDLEFLNNEPRKGMLFRRDRRLTELYDPYSVDELLEMFKPYLLEMDTGNLSPREVRLIETILYAWSVVLTTA